MQLDDTGGKGVIITSLFKKNTNTEDYPQVVSCYAPFYLGEQITEASTFPVDWVALTELKVDWQNPWACALSSREGPLRMPWPLPYTLFWVSSSIEDICFSGRLFQESPFPSGKCAPNLGGFSAFGRGVINHEMCIRSFNLGWQRDFGNLSPRDPGFN